MASVTASITAENSFTSALSPTAQTYFNVSVEALPFGSTVTLQKSYDSGSTWYDQNPDGVFTHSQELIVLNAEAVQWRIGVKTGHYVSGTILVRLSQ